MRACALVVASMLASIGVLSPGLAQVPGAPGSPEALQAAADLTAVMSDEMIGQMSGQFTAQIWPKLEAEYKPKVDEATLSDLRSEFERTLTKFTTETMKLAPAVYARYFSAQELRDMAAFYKTPTGAKALQLMPKVMGEFYATILPNLSGVNRELQASFESVLRKHGYLHQ